MSTEHDETRPVPAQPGGRAGDQPTTPIPRPGAGRSEEPTLVFDTFAAEGDRDRASGAADATRPMPLTEPEPARASAATDATGPMPVAEPSPARTSAFATGAAGPRSAAASAATPPPTAPAPQSDEDRTADERTADERTAAEKPEAAPERESTSLRVGTVVWGLVLAIIGAGVIAIAAGAQFDLELALIGLLALAGAALVIGSVVTATRRKR